MGGIAARHDVRHRAEWTNVDGTVLHLTATVLGDGSFALSHWSSFNGVA
jgi:hypothetical protein